MKNVSERYKAQTRSGQAQYCARISVTKNDLIYTFEDNVILSIVQKDDVDPLSRRLPTETVEFTIIDINDMYDPHNPSGVWEYIDTNTVVGIQLGCIVGGAVEWLQWDNYLLDGKPASENGEATFRASRRLAHLSGTYYKGKCEFLPSITLDYEARRVFEDAGLTSADYEIDTSLMNKYSIAAPPVASHAECLQLIAHAAGCCLYTKPDGVVAIKPFAIPTVSNGFLLNRKSIVRNRETSSKIPPVSVMSTKQYVYSLASATPENIVAYVFDINGTETYHVDYDLIYSPSITTDKGTLSDVHLYGRAADFTLTSSEAATVTISGIRVNINVKTTSATLSSGGEQNVEDNPMMNYAYEHNQLVGDYLSYRLSHQIEYRGSPELQCGDCIYYETKYNTLALALVLSTKTHYSGGISGTLVLKNLSVIDSADLYDSGNILVEDVAGATVRLSDMADYTSEYTIGEIDGFISEV